MGTLTEVKQCKKHIQVSVLLLHIENTVYSLYTTSPLVLKCNNCYSH